MKPLEEYLPCGLKTLWDATKSPGKELWVSLLNMLHPQTCVSEAEFMKDLKLLFFRERSQQCLVESYVYAMGKMANA